MSTHKEKLKQQTKSSLLDALLALMNEKDFDAITITELCQRANVSRVAFYRHYESMIAIIEEFFAHSFTQANAENPSRDDSIHLINQMGLDFIDENKGLFSLLAASKETPILYDMFRTMIMDYVRLQDFPIDVPDDMFESMVSYCAGGVLHTLFDWANGGYSTDKEDICMVLDRLHFINQLMK